MAAAPAIPPETIGDRIRRARKAKGFSQHELAEKSGISRQSIMAIAQLALPDCVAAESILTLR